MDKKTAWILGIIALIIIVILVRRGNVPATTNTTDTRGDTSVENSTDKEDTTTETEKDSDAKTEDEDIAVSNGLDLSAVAMANGEVKLTWTAPSGLTEANRFIIVRDEAAEPVHIGNNFWRRFHHSVREATWVVPAGTQYFRLCVTENNQNDICSTYSNDVMVEVK